MRVFSAGPGMREDTERAIEGAMQGVASLERACRDHAPATLRGQPVYVAVFSPDDAMVDVELHVRRVLQALVYAAKPQPKEQAA